MSFFLKKASMRSRNTHYHTSVGQSIAFPSKPVTHSPSFIAEVADSRLREAAKPDQAIVRD
jgi:hypothetical protein